MEDAVAAGCDRLDAVGDVSRRCWDCVVCAAEVEEVESDPAWQGQCIFTQVRFHAETNPIIRCRCCW